MSVAAFMHYAIADGSRTPTGFGRLIFTHAALKPLTIRQYSLRALPCLSKNQPVKTARHLSVSIFR